MFRILLPLVASSVVWSGVTSFSLSSKPLSVLLRENAGQISGLKDAATLISSKAPTDDVFYLRYCLDPSTVDDAALKSKLEANIEWRCLGDGSSICDAATSAISAATSGGGWTNDPVRSGAPNASTINEFITSDSVTTTTSRKGDLVYIVRTSNIDDVALMSKTTQTQMTDFFLYAKEINAAAANIRSIETDRLVCVLTANDLSGVKLIGGSKEFRKALSAASNKASELYPMTAGPTLLLNLPRLVSALAKLFTPLFSAEVRKRLKFEQGPLSELDSLGDIMTDAPSREKFMDDLDTLIYES